MHHTTFSMSLTHVLQTADIEGSTLHPFPSSNYMIQTIYNIKKRFTVLVEKGSHSLCFIGRAA
jgi:hypothetical protein